MRRAQIGNRVIYKDRSIHAEFVGPDLVAVVDGDIELPSFYMNIQAVYDGGKRYIDACEKEQQYVDGKKENGR